MIFEGQCITLHTVKMENSTRRFAETFDSLVMMTTLMRTETLTLTYGCLVRGTNLYAL